MDVTPEVGQAPLMKVTEVADLLGVSRRTVNRLADSGRLSYVQISPKIRRYSRQDVEELLRQAHVSAAS